MGERFSAAELAECAAREAKMRRQVYGRRSDSGVLTAFQRRQVEMMEEIAADYRSRMWEEENDMFGEEAGNE